MQGLSAAVEVDDEGEHGALGDGPQRLLAGGVQGQTSAQAHVGHQQHFDAEDQCLVDTERLLGDDQQGAATAGPRCPPRLPHLAPDTPASGKPVAHTISVGLQLED